MNKVILMGRLTRDVEMRQTASGVNVARFSIAVNRRFAREGNQQADFINCAAWRQTGEFIARYFHKGSMIAVVGQLQSRSWEGQDGKKQYAMEVVVDEAYFTGSKAETNTGSSAMPYGGAQGGGFGGGYPQQQAPNNAFGGGFGQAPMQNNDDPFSGGFEDGGFSDIDGSEDDLPF